MITRNKKRKGFYLLLVIFLAVFLPLSVYYLHTPIDLTNYKGLLLPKIEEAAHLNIELKSLGLTILPYPRLSFGGLTIKEGGYSVLKAESMMASLALVPLIFHKEFEVKNLVIAGSDVFIKREADGGLNIIRILKETFIPVSIKNVRVKTGKAHFTDEFLQSGIRYEATDIDATFIPNGPNDFSYRGTAKLLPSVEIKFSGETKNGARDFEGRADIKELDIEQIWPYLSGIIPGGRLEGDIDTSLHYKISEKPLPAHNSASGASETFKQISIKGSAAYHKLAASIPSLFDKRISSSQGIFDIEIASNQGVLTVSVPKAQAYFPDFIVFAGFRFESGKGGNDRLVLNLNTTRIPLLSIKEQFFISLLPDSIRKQIALTSFSRGQLKISNLKLIGDVNDIRMPDYYKTPGSLLATVEVRDADFAHKDLSHAFSMVDGTVEWKDGNLSLLGIKGKYGNSVVEKLEGTIDGLLDAPFVQFSGSCLMDAEEASDESKKWQADKALPESFAAHGIVPLSFKLSWALESGDGLALSFSADAAFAEFGYSSWLKKEKGFPMTARADLLARSNTISVEKARVSFGIASAVDIKGLFGIHGEPAYELNIKASDMPLDDIDAIAPYFEKEFSSKGKLSADVDITKAGNGAAKFKGTVNLRDGEFETRLLPKMASGVNLTANFYGDSADIIVDSMKTGNSFLSGSVNIPDIKTANMDFNFESPYLEYEDIYPRARVLAAGGYYYDGELEGIPVTGKGKISAKEARVAGFYIKSLQADALLKPDAILLKAVFVKDNGKVVSNFVYSKDRGDSFLWRLGVNASGVGLEPLLKEIGAAEKILTGDADIKMELSAGRGGGDIAKRIDGKCEIYSKNGRLWKFVALSKIFSIVNIISIDELFREGLPYKMLTGNFVIKDGVISTDDLLLDSSSMRMSAIGTIDVPRISIDAKLGLHPFVTVDKIITKIPLAGWIIGGKEQSAVSMYYTIKGPLRDPDVEAIPIQALGEGVWGIFKRILRLPVDAVEPLVK